MPDISVMEALQMDYDDQLGSFVTESGGTMGEGTPKTGRPRIHSSNAARVAAHRAAKLPKNIAVGCRVGTRYGVGIVHTAKPGLPYQSPPQPTA
jgi:hypothetical protein